ncbi:MAG: efflux RND transporter periplasmic adaptor subunit, partial [Acidobacteriales bacterium]|nr:efflux RND transporter periplasmic adaptor subunit [Terriglobales bacterium]
MSIRRSIFVLTLITLALPVLVFSIRANRAQDERPDQNLQQYTVVRGDVEVTVTAIGTVEADQVTRLSFASSGRIVALPVEVGAAVQSGEVLAQLNDEAQQLAYDQAALALELAQLQKDQLLAGADETQINIAEANVQSAQGAISGIANAVSDEDIHAAELTYAQAQQALEDATQARATAPGGQSESAYALLDARVGQASFNAEIARLQLEELQNGSSAELNVAYARLAQAQRELEQLQAGPPQSEIDRADVEITRAQIRLDEAQAALDDLRLIAPFDGFVTALNAEAGGLAAPGLPVVEITDLDPLRLTVQVDEIDVRQIREGMPARVRVDALPGVTLAAALEGIA